MKDGYPDCKENVISIHQHLVVEENMLPYNNPN